MALDFAKPLQGFHDKKKSVRVHPVTGAGGFSAFVYTCMLNVDWDGAPDCYGLDRPGFPEQTGPAEPSPGTVSCSTLLPSPNASYSVTNASAGVKIRPFPKASKLVLTANVLVRLDSGGLHAKPAPLVGLGYTF